MPTQRASSCRDFIPRAGSGLETLPEGRENSGGPPGWSEGPPGGPGVVRRHFQTDGSGRETHMKDRECSGGHPG